MSFAYFLKSNIPLSVHFLLYVHCLLLIEHKLTHLVHNKAIICMIWEVLYDG